VAIPAMTIEHLVLFGFVEAAVTALVIKYFQKNEPEMLG
jgi:ABC-type Co2+ transport system permease subunit